MSKELGFNLKLGINYCAPVEKIGFRGVGKNGTARLIPLPKLENTDKELFMMFGVDVPAQSLPYIPDMGAESDFAKNGYWHYYKIEKALFIWHLTPSPSEAETFKQHDVLQIVFFSGEKDPRIFVNKLHVLTEQGILKPEDRKKVDEILTEQQIILS